MDSKILVLITLVILVLFAYVGVQFNSHKPLPAAIKLETDGQPTIGFSKALIHVVVFEEPKCSDCKNFTNNIFPKIKKDYIDTNKIRYTLIPVSFLPNSMPIAMAWLSVFHQDPEYPNSDLFFKYVDTTYANQPSESEDWATFSNLEKFAKEASPAIKIDQLHEDVAKEKYRIQIEKNTKYGFSMMDHTITTPAVYVNGIKVEDITYSNIKNVIDQVNQQRGALH